MFGKSVWQAVLLAVCGTFGVATSNVVQAAEPLTLEQALADDVRLDAILHDAKRDLLSQSAGWWHRGGGCYGYARPYAFGCFRAPLCYRAPICYTPVVSYCSYPVFNCYPAYNCGYGYGGFGYSGFGYSGSPSGVGYGGIYGGFSSFGISSFGYSNAGYSNSGSANRGYSNSGYSNVGSPNVNYGNVNYANSRSPAPRVTNYQTAPQSAPQYVAPSQRPVFNFASYAPANPAPRVTAVPAIYGGCYYW